MTENLPPEGCTCSHWWIDPNTRQEFPEPGEGREIRFSLDESCPVHSADALRRSVAQFADRAHGNAMELLNEAMQSPTVRRDRRS